jgi:hypothetical protein
MKRIILIATTAALILAVWAVAASACVTEPATCTPANQGNGQSGNHAPSPTIKSHPSSNDNGVSNSPALVYNGSSVGSACGAF